MTSSARGWETRVAARLDEVRAAGRWRQVRAFDALGPTGTLAADGRAVTSFASNDYLGLSAHPAVVAAAHLALDRWGAGATASRLVVGSRPAHHDLEEALAAWKGTEAALVFPTGFAANVGVLTALAGPGTRILSDALNHASIVDGCRLARGEAQVVAHADLDAMTAALAADDRPTIVVVDSVFSMDGDAADLTGLAALCTRHGAALVLDEAHAVLGPDLDPADHPDLLLVRVGTLSKALGALGGFVACSTAVRDLLVNVARPFIFTTALAPADAAAAHAALTIVRSPEGDGLRARLRHHVDRLAPGHPSPIVPVVLGDEAAAVAAAGSLLAQGLLVPAIRPPTVPPGTSRLRITFSAAHTDAEVDRLLAALPRVPSVAVSSVAASSVAAPSVAPRPGVLVAVLGTGTEVGKTWVGAALLAALRADGRTVAARKPAQSADADDLGPSDADVLAAATGEAPLAVCPAHRRYSVAMAPPMAAAATGEAPFTVADLAAEVTWPAGIDVGLVETAGGAASPAADDGDSLALVRAVRPDHVVLVADAGLGTLNGIGLTVAALRTDEVDRLTVILNRYDDADALHRANRDWLVTREGLDVVVDVEALTELFT